MRCLKRVFSRYESTLFNSTHATLNLIMSRIPIWGVALVWYFCADICCNLLNHSAIFFGFTDFNR